jgi:hypothetical protein
VNTPTHALLNLALLRRGDDARRRLALPVLAGAALPDLPILVLWAVATFVWRQPQAEIWARTYFEPAWQRPVDALHSLPLIALAAALLRAAPARAFLASMALHAVADLLTHHDDAHRHLWPLSGWRFASPVSYWDPAHFGAWFAPLECALALALLPGAWRALRPRAARAALVVVGTAYVAGLAAGVWRLAGPPGRDAGTLQGAVTGRR